jgi:hypothetical protein
MAVVNSKDGCLSCIYFLNTDNDFIGSCRRYPLYQNRHSSEWCGEFSAIPPNPVFETMVQDIEIATETKEDPKEKRKKVLEEASKVEPKPKGRPKKV